MPASNPLPLSKLRRLCSPGIFNFKTTADIEPLDEVIGQERAVRSIQLGLNMLQPGYNLFVTGPEGSGKQTIVRDMVTRHAREQTSPDGWCMVNNFEDSFRPLAICVPAGKATRFGKSMQRLIRWLQIKLPRDLSSDSFKQKAASTGESLQAQEQQIMERLEQLAREHSIQITKTSEGLRPIPLLDGKPITREQFSQLPKEQQDAINAGIALVGEQMEQGVSQILTQRQDHQKQMEKLMQDTALSIVKERIDLIRAEYEDCDPIKHYLDAVQQDIVDQVENFISPDNNTTEDVAHPMARQTSPFDRYKVNVLVDHRKVTGAPVIFEPNPSFQNLFGYIDKKTVMGAVTTDFTMVQAGSLLQANGGYLIVEVEALLMDPKVWEILKRSLQNKQLYIQDAPYGSVVFTGSLRPEPIPLEVKIILVGNHATFNLLQSHDPKFNKLFKVRADFDYESELTDERAQLYARFIARVCKENDLLPFTPDGVAAIVDYGARTVSDQSKLSLRFGPIVGLIQEADYWAKQGAAEQVTQEHVYKAIDEYRFRYNLYEEKIHASYAEDTILIDVDGDVVGQVNALAVYQMGEISFGRPSRITAETFMGEHGIVNIEREANMSGSTHDKGVLILSGYLGRVFAQTFPLSLSISLTFEQSYSGVDGDSASSTELYAILSSLSGIPIRQSIAVTGSVNQKGEVQAIGGVNQKIEGFFEVCKSKGLTGRQGVMIPASNVKNLMLSREVLQAVEAGQFHIYAVGAIEEGIEILTGIPAGAMDDQGKFAVDSVYGKVQQKLMRYLKQSIKLKKWAQG